MKYDSHYPDLIVLGSTGSVGEQAMDVARAHRIPVRAVTAHRSVATVEAQVREFHPDFAVMTDETAASDLRARVADTSTRVLAGFEGITEMLHAVKTDNPLGITVENSILGEAGLLPTLETLKAGHKLALANKESLVVGGELVMSLAHPTWKMGAKITVDSATLMNKGFEVIEAVHLFGVAPEKVEVIVHRESMIHSMVEYIDHSIIAQMSVPDMRHCVQYALTHPRRLPAEGTLKQADLFALGKLTFGRPDTEVFPLLALARDCIAKGGALPCVLNAANEIVVAAFLDDSIRFCQIPELVSRTVHDLSYTAAWHSYDRLMEADTLARETARRLLNR